MANQTALKREHFALDSIIKSGGWCPLCLLQVRPCEIQNHHIAGRQNSNLTIPVCLRCHQLLSLKQSKWPKDWINPGKSPEERIKFIKRGLQDIQVLAEQEIKWLKWEQSNGAD